MPGRRHDKHRRRVRWVHSILICVCSLIAFSSVGQEVVLHLQNGDRVSGTLVSASTNAVILATVYAGRITIPAGQIQRSENLPLKGAAQPVALPKPSTSQTSPSASSNSQKVPPPISAQPAPKMVASPPLTASATNSTNKKPSDFRKFLAAWNGEAEVGLNLAFSSKDRQTYAGRFRASHLHSMPNQRSLKNDLDYLVSYGRTDGVLSDNRMDGSWKLEYDLGKRFLVYNAVGAGYDEIRRIDLRYDVGPGLGYKWVTRTNLVFSTELGGNYQEQFFSNDGSKRRYSLRLAEESWWQIASKLRLDEKIEFFPEIDHFGDYRIRLESNLSYLLPNNLTLKLTVIDLYETDPAKDVSRNDLQIRSSIGIRF
ncbi:MAG: DUF481 domain-containing protein [Verrucomicrobia bacterium]|nr:DUF481 domain-containing protein [Verrucomicrobiota bacterium]